ncbi:helix-turn-helix domain-containing protein [Paracoccus onubensis]|uniref:Chromosomal replication initiator DnaA C-terminal domain-containing protein n=1 Tax=Paracoccus onubensis TaxID=1675788 RepID=A0A418T1T2_9RHOB|nr:helix-turn-helix domain-containing protein [Paracoccus onubensis]RJE87113.1 hypothetical protein D3P04_05010 [Paracoccus onubensis]
MISAKTIFNEVAAFRSIDTEELLGTDRSSSIAWARQEAYWAIRLYTSLSFHAIGRILGRDHTTIRSGVHAVQSRRDGDLDYRNELAELLTKINLRNQPEPVSTASEYPSDIAERVIRDPSSITRGDIVRMAFGLMAISAANRNMNLNDRDARKATRIHLAGGKCNDQPGI